VELRLQAEDRSHRIGVKKTCVYRDVIIKGTYDEKLMKLIREGRDVNDYFKTSSLTELLNDDL
jgi:SNF2 family DNA or RNA helicase